MTSSHESNIPIISTGDQADRDEYITKLAETIETDKKYTLSLVAFALAIIGFFANVVGRNEKWITEEPLPVRYLLVGSLVMLMISATGFFWWYRLLHGQRVHTAMYWFDKTTSRFKEIYDNHSGGQLADKYGFFYNYALYFGVGGLLGSFLVIILKLII